MAHKHVSRPVPDGLSTSTNAATRVRRNIIKNFVPDRTSVPAEHDKARERHAPQETRGYLFLVVS